MKPALNFPRLIEVLQMDTPQLRNHLIEELERLDYEVKTDNDNYVIGIPSTVRDKAHPRVCFVAHIDVVNNRVGPRIVLTKGHELKNTAGGCLGADDRAGVFAILENIEKAEYKPCVIFCNYEEVGGVGVRKLVEDDAFGPWAEYVDVFIEPDRKGGDEYVWYSSVMPKSMHQWLQRFGYKPDTGSYSDVKTLTEKYKKPHANISVGYRAQHTAQETLNIPELAFTVRNMGQMLKSKPPVHIMTATEISSYSYGGSTAYGGRDYSGKNYPNSVATTKTTTSGSNSGGATKTPGFSKTYSSYEEFTNCAQRKEYMEKLKKPAATSTETEETNILILGEKHPTSWTAAEWKKVQDFMSGVTDATKSADEEELTPAQIRMELAGKGNLEIAKILVENFDNDNYFDERIDLTGAGTSSTGVAQ